MDGKIKKIICVEILIVLAIAVAAVIGILKISPAWGEYANAPLTIKRIMRNEPVESAYSPIEFTTNGKQMLHVPDIDNVTVEYHGGTAEQHAIFDKALSRWNSTNRVHFAKISQGALVKVRFLNGHLSKMPEAMGVTNKKYSNETGLISSEEIDVYPEYIAAKGGNANGYLTTYTHELGHTIGLDHDKKNSVMNMGGNLKFKYPITKANIRAIEQIYYTNRKEIVR